MESEHRVPKVSLRNFSERTYTTFVSRARAAERLSTQGTLWNIALAVSSTATLALSVVSLSNPQYMGGRAGLIACLFSILTLVLSLIVSLFNYGGRARDMFHSYRTIQRVSAEAERLDSITLTETDLNEALGRLDTEYQLGLDQSENHSTLDYWRARRIEPRSKDPGQVHARRQRFAAVIRQSALDLIPVTFIGAAACFMAWVFLNL